MSDPVGYVGSCRGLAFPGGVAAVAGVPVGACLHFLLLYAFYTLPCLVFLLIIWKNSSRAAAGVPGGVVFFHPVGAGVRFLLKKRTKKRKHGNV